jgi:hypothetical protein
MTMPVLSCQRSSALACGARNARKTTGRGLAASGAV